MRASGLSYSMQPTRWPETAAISTACLFMIAGGARLGVLATRLGLGGGPSRSAVAALGTALPCQARS